MKKVLVISERIFLNLFGAGLKDYSEQHENIQIDLYYLDYPNYSLSGMEKLKYKLNKKDYKKKYYDGQRAKLVKLIQDYDEILFFNFLIDEEHFIQGEFEQALKKKTCKVYFVDSIKTMEPHINYFYLFKNIYTFERQDIAYAKEKFGIDIKHVVEGTNYKLYPVKDVGKNKYDICFVGLAVEKRLRYLQKIAELCERKKYKFYLRGHFWHNSNWFSYTIGKYKFQHKYPLLAKYVVNSFVQPRDLANVYRSSKICLNINVAYHNSFNTRNFDIMISNSLLITDKEDCETLNIEPDKDFIMCENEDEMVRQVEYYLQNANEREEIAARGQKAVDGKYLFNNTLDEILGE